MAAVVPDPLKKIFSYIDDEQEKFISNLAEAVRIKSVSAWIQNREDVFKMIHWVGEKLEKVGASVEYVETAMQKLPDGKEVPYPPVLLGSLGCDGEKKTLLIYGHLDVQPALREDGWDTDPFELTRKDGKLFGRGASDDKGPVLGWLHALEAFRACGVDVPVNIRFCFEGMEECSSECLEETLTDRKSFLDGVDYVCISDNIWLGTQKPCLTYGLRGICYFYLTVECSSMDLHSGMFGGTVNEGMFDLVHMLNTLVDKEGNLLIDGLLDPVAEVTRDELATYAGIDFDVEQYRQEIGVPRIRTAGDKVKTLMARWRHPALSLHGIHGAFSDDGSKTVIPGKVTGKFSIRIVPNQTPDFVEATVRKYLDQRWEERGSPNKYSLSMDAGGRCWASDPRHPNYEAAATATKMVYGVEPDLTREGGSIPITLTLEQMTGKNVLLLPMGSSDDGAHSQNEKIDVRNYIEGTKLMGAYLHQLGQLK